MASLIPLLYFFYIGTAVILLKIVSFVFMLLPKILFLTLVGILFIIYNIIILLFPYVRHRNPAVYQKRVEFLESSIDTTADRLAKFVFLFLL